jgi:primary-amine oxidase
MTGSELPLYIANNEAVANRDVVVWYYAGLHHVIRDEDANMTQIMWVGFMLKPFNVWSTTPLYP